MTDDKQKPIGDRVKESITILNKLKEIGIAETDPSYKETRVRMNEWIRTGEAWAGKIDFHLFGRRAEIILPYRKDRVASMKLLAPK